MLIFLRHGRTAHNAEGRLQGHHDAPLDEAGIEQSRLVGAHLREHYDIAHVVTSSLQRTVQTAHEAGVGALASTVDDRWREMDFGSYDQQRLTDVREDLIGRWADDPEWTPAGGGESLADLHRRVGAAMVDLAAIHDRVGPERGVLVVSHATPIKSALAHAVCAGPQMILHLHIGVASVSTVRRTRGVMVLTSFNERPFRASLRR